MCIYIPQWSIKLHSGSSETLQQYKVNLSAIAVHLERLSDYGEVYWVLQGKHNFLEKARLLRLVVIVAFFFQYSDNSLV